MESLSETSKFTSQFISEIQQARSEVLIAVNSILYLEYLAENGLVDSLKQAQNNGVDAMILYSEEDQSEARTSQILSTIKNYAQIKRISGIYGTIFLIDNSKVLTIDGDDGTKAFVVYSNNNSIVKNIGSLFDSLWNEKEMLDSIIAIKDNLADSNKQIVEANKQLKIHDQIQREFINMAAHELRTPIMPILGYAEILEAEQEQEEQAGVAGEKENNRNKNKRNNISAIIRSAKRLEQVSQRILDTASIEAKTFRLHKERLNLADVLLNAVDDQIITIAQDSEINNNIKLRYEPSEDVILIHADRMRLTQVISNILSNAVKFTKKGTILITLKKDNDKAIVGIQDTGFGIDAEIMSRLFSKFAAKSDIGGIGLGLFISKSIIEAHGGSISAVNNEDGETGATFTFSLPLTK